LAWLLRTLALSAAIGTAVTLTEPAQVRLLVLDHVRIVDGTGAPPIENGRILIEGERIAGVGAAGAIQVPSGAETVDLAGRTVIRG
jgi:imidazolonepropionase-like amidohydrolase